MTEKRDQILTESSPCGNRDFVLLVVDAVFEHLPSDLFDVFGSMAESVPKCVRLFGKRVPSSFLAYQHLSYLILYVLMGVTRKIRLKGQVSKLKLLHLRTPRLRQKRHPHPDQLLWPFWLEDGRGVWAG